MGEDGLAESALPVGADGSRQDGTAERAVSAAPGSRQPLGRRFAQLWSAFALASTGDGFAYGAVPLLAVAVDPRPLAVSAVIAADRIPWLLVALPAGSFADRFDRGRVMAAASAARAVLFGVVALLLVTHTIDLALLIIAVLANASGRAVYYSAVQAAVPEIVESGALDRANGRLTGTEAAAEHLGGPIVGAFAFAASRAVPFVMDAAAMAASVFPFTRVRSAAERPVAAVSAPLLAGVRRLFADRRLRLLLGLLAGLAGLQGLVSGILVLVATKDWGVHTSAYGLFVAAGAAGNLPGALLADRFVRRVGSVPVLLVAGALAGLGYLLMAASHSWLPAGASFALTGFAVGVGSVVAITLRQRLAPPEMMGRIGAAWRGIVWGAAPAGSLVAGGLALLGGLRLPLLVAGGAQIVLALVLAVPLVRLLGSRGAGTGPPPQPAVM